MTQMLLNLCVEHHKDARIRHAQNYDELRLAVADALADMTGGCLLSAATLARVSLPTIYGAKNGTKRPTFGTLLALASALAPGYVVSFAATCGITPPPTGPNGGPAVWGWERMTGEHSAFERETLNGKATGRVRDANGRVYGERKPVAITTTRVNADVDHPVAAE